MPSQVFNWNVSDTGLELKQVHAADQELRVKQAQSFWKDRKAPWRVGLSERAKPKMAEVHEIT
jgi:hypothetical protein